MLTNCIVYYNTGGNNNGCTSSLLLHHPFGPWPGNFTNAPQLFVDGHLTSTSPCRGAGTNLVTGTDIFGQPWLNPPSVGCAEWQPAPVVPPPQLQLTSDPVGFTANVSVLPASRLSPITGSRTGFHFKTTATSVLPDDQSGCHRSQLRRCWGLSTGGHQCVRRGDQLRGAVGGSLRGRRRGESGTPYSTWAAAATNIQDAISAALTNEVVLVANGTYATGGKSMDGVITNRVSVDKAILVQSVNGPSVTTIQGAWDPTSTNGPGAVRCVWLTNNATLSGFTVSGGATRSGTGALSTYGAVFLAALRPEHMPTIACSWQISPLTLAADVSVNLSHCTLSGNHAAGSGANGGGAAYCNLKNCLITSNVSEQSSGGGGFFCNATNCAFTKNRAILWGSGTYQGTYLNCTFSGNTSGAAYKQMAVRLPTRL